MSDDPAPFVNNDPKTVFKARLERTQDGIWRAEYMGETNAAQPAKRTVLDTHIGTTEESVRAFVEALATQMGYRRVEWDVATSDSSACTGQD